MSKILWNSLLVTPALLGAALIGSSAIAAEPVASEANTVVEAPAVETTSASALEQVGVYSAEGSGNTVAQVTSVSQLSDVQPTDWAFQALQSLVERYGCIAGYPDGTYRGNRALTRYEFAAGLNACLDRVNELIAAGTADLVSKEDLATLQRLQEEFAAELATLRGRVDALEARTAELEANQFSTTAKLTGEVIFAPADVFGGGVEDVEGSEPDVNTILGYRARLNVDASFTGEDRLRVRLQARDVEPFDSDLTGTDMTRLGFDGSEDGDFQIDDLYYRFRLGENTQVAISAAESDYNDFVNVFNPGLDPSGSGAISRFGRFNPIYRSGEGAGIVVTQNFGRALDLSVGYLASNADDPSNGAGLFNGNYSALAQVGFNPTGNIRLGLTYAHAYYAGGEVDITGGTGSARAQDPFGETFLGDVATSADLFGAQAAIQFGNLGLSGWVGYTEASPESFETTIGDEDVEIWNWAAALSFRDFGKEGALAGVVFGMPPRARGVIAGVPGNSDTSYHLEGFYRYPLTENIAITPGVLVIFNPEHNNDNDTIYVGTIRTTFSF